MALHYQVRLTPAEMDTLHSLLQYEAEEIMAVDARTKEDNVVLSPEALEEFEEIRTRTLGLLEKFHVSHPGRGLQPFDPRD